MMSAVVVQFSRSNESKLTECPLGYRSCVCMRQQTVSMMFCEKVVIGYSALHHLLLYLQSKNKELITSFADRWVDLFMDKMTDSHGKSCCKSLGKLLIYTMISSKYKWCDIAEQFVRESFTRNVKWMVQKREFMKYNNTSFVADRLKDTFQAQQTSRRLIIFKYGSAKLIPLKHSFPTITDWVDHVVQSVMALFPKPKPF